MFVRKKKNVKNCKNTRKMNISAIKNITLKNCQK